MKIDFRFNIDDKVMNPLGTVGIVACLMLDNTKINQVFVKTPTGESWWREDQLTTYKP